MDDRAAQAVKEIAEERQRLADQVEALEQRVRASVDWRRYAGRNIWLTLGLAFVGGFIVSGILNLRPR